VTATWYRFDWDIFATQRLTDDLVAAFPGAPGNGRAALASVLPAIFRSSGGLPVSRARLSQAARTRAARRLLVEAAGHAARPQLEGGKSDGYRLVPSTVAELGKEIAGAQKVAINRASRDELLPLPVIGAAIADAIIEDRRLRGPFTNAGDLMERIDGIGPTNIAELAPWLDFRPPAAGEAPVRLTGDFDTDFPALVKALSGRSDWAGLLDALDVIATSAAGDPHPSVSRGRVRDLAGNTPGITDLPGVEDADWVGILLSDQFVHAVSRFIDDATSRVDVCVFHMTVPQPNESTHKLLDSLADAKSRGVAVRVLLDRDRVSDPYRSTVINSPARTWLAAQGIPCRFDTEERLLHSKFVVIDRDIAIVGSHNWTKTSLVRMEDLSLVVHSRTLAGDLRRRFSSLWAASD
jgi:DNA uptake protein ComE-like DNA-binding protein